jgi:putative DNA-binding protein
MEENNMIIIYTDESGLTKLDVRLEDETLWLTQAQMCELYQTSKSNVSEHIKHIFEEGELQEDGRGWGTPRNALLLTARRILPHSTTSI